MGYTKQDEYDVADHWRDRSFNVCIYYYSASNAAETAYNQIRTYLESLVDEDSIDGAEVKLFRTDFSFGWWQGCDIDDWQQATAHRRTTDGVHLFVNSNGCSLAKNTNAWKNDTVSLVSDEHRYDASRMGSVAMQEILHNYISVGIAKDYNLIDDNPENGEHDLGESFQKWWGGRVATPMALTYPDSQETGTCSGSTDTQAVADRVSACTADAVRQTYNEKS